MYKNWQAIATIKNQHLMAAIALLDLNDPADANVVARFPEYFQESPPKDTGPIPLSVILEMTRRHPEGQEDEDGGPYPIFADVVSGCYIEGKSFAMPVFAFCFYADTYDCPVLPSELEGAERVGEVRMWKERSVTLITKTGDCCYFVPSECVDVTK